MVAVSRPGRRSSERAANLDLAAASRRKLGPLLHHRGAVVQADRCGDRQDDRHGREPYRVRDVDLQPGVPVAVVNVILDDVACQRGGGVLAALLQLVVMAVPLDGQLLLSHLRGRLRGYGGDVARRCGPPRDADADHGRDHAGDARSRADDRNNESSDIHSGQLVHSSAE